MALTQDERRKLAHLLRRAGFGARPDEWQEYSELGVAGATQRLLHPESVPDHLEDIRKTISDNFVDFNNLEGVRQWWVFRMVHTRRPLEEKMTLFWHDHFATANYKVNNPRWMWQQNETFRRNALGNFRTMLQEISRDPAMLVWLDGAQSRNGEPNENYARELLELFTMGVGSGYTERDIQEAARCFTGWVYNNEARTFTFNPFLHDDGSKTFFKQTGNFHGDDIIDIVVRQPATARFLSTKLWKYFVHGRPTKSDIDRLAQVYFKSGYDIRAVVEAIITSSAFYSPEAYYTRVKSPIEFALTVIRTLDAPLLSIDKLPELIANMGQNLFNPPSVKGWPGGREWINTRTLLARVNFSSQVTSEMNRRGALSERVRGTILLDEQPSSAEQIVTTVWNGLMPGRPLPAKTKAALLNYVRDGKTEIIAAAPDEQMEAGQMMMAKEPPTEQMERGERVNPAPAVRLDPKLLDQKLPGLLSLIMGTPDYQLA